MDLPNNFCLVLEVKPKLESDLEWLENSQCRSLNDLIGLGQPYQMLCDRKKVRIFVLQFDFSFLVIIGT